MHIDNRLDTISAWPVADDADIAFRGFVQICDILDSAQPQELTRYGQRLLVRLRGKLSPEARARLLTTVNGDAGNDARAARMARFLSPGTTRGTQIKGPLSVAADAHAVALSQAAQAPVLEKPRTTFAEPVKTPAFLESGHQIGELIRRIDHFHEGRQPRASMSLSEGMSWRSDASGLLIEGGTAFASDHPVRLDMLDFDDPGQMRRSLARNTAFANRRAHIPGRGHALITGRPVFDPATGRFRGYRGQLLSDGEASALGIAAATVAEVAHEVRTPLNAILGYAEMIEEQVLGPAPESYRRDARAIISDANRLLAAVDALGDAAALEEGRAVELGARTDPRELAEKLSAAFAPLAEQRAVRLVIELGGDATTLAAESASLYRAVSRLITAAIAFSHAGESVFVSFNSTGLDISRPSRLKGRSARALLSDAIDLPDEDNAPLLGLAFTLRILRRLAEANGGALDIGERTFTVRIPNGPAANSAEAS
ncbi:MAG: HAMP domain-containing sensor histidine kinase [Pacificimonas sp.]